MKKENGLHQMDLLETTARLLSSHDLCDNCLGRQFGNLLSGLSNSQRGRSLRYLLRKNDIFKNVREIFFEAGQKTITDQKNEMRSSHICLLLEQKFGVESWQKFSEALLLYLGMVSEIKMRRDYSLEAALTLYYLARQDYRSARETLKKGQNCLQFQKILSTSGINDLDSMLVTSSSSCHYCLGLFGFDRLKKFLFDVLGSRSVAVNSSRVISEDVEMESCELCRGFFQEISLNQWCNRVESKCEKIEFRTFVVGSIIPQEILEKEDEIRASFDLSEWAEIIKSEVNREIGKRLLQRWGHLDRDVDVKTQDLLIIINLVKSQVELEIHPVFIEGRYCKFVRDIPQSHWPCKDCDGKGCALCNFTGKKYPTSVAELILDPIIPLFEAEDGKFHGAGREDIDARMLGEGRPFVMEIIRPKKRSLPLDLLERAINEHGKGKIKVKLVGYSSRARLRQLKGLSSKTSKKYLAIVVVHGKTVDEIMEKKDDIEQFFVNREIQQWTPYRVLHRRANKLRRRTVHSLRLLGPDSDDPSLLRVEITCDGGLYVKELISGDDGRTNPSFAQVVKAPSKVVMLDVLAVNLTDIDNGDKK